jgi:two-component system KDP operon response regulator KdpE
LKSPVAAFRLLARREEYNVTALPGKTVVLVIDDEVPIRRLFRACLERNGYGILEAATGETGIGAAIQSQPDAVILDLGLPDMDGMQVLRRLREWSTTPVLVVSVRDSESDIVMALDGGANDYLTKPFRTEEVLARLRAALRNRQQTASRTVFNLGHLQIDLASRSVKVRGQLLKLAPTEYALLRYFVHHAGRVITHRQLMQELWKLNDIEKVGLLRVHVAHLRDKIETDSAEPELLITVPGIGYRLEVKE